MTQPMLPSPARTNANWEGLGTGEVTISGAVANTVPEAVA